MPIQARRGSRRGIWRGTGLVAAGALTALTSLAALVILPAGTGGAGAAGGSGAAAPTWVHYFFPLKVGWTCHESLEATGVTGDETLTVASVGRTSQGRSVTITEGSSSTAGGVSVPTNAALHYVLTTGGQLVSVPSGIQVGGQPFILSGTTTYPNVQTLLSGGSAVSRLHIAVPLDAADRAELQAVLPASATTLNMAVAVQQSGSSVAALHTPMGTFHHLLAVRSVLKSIAFTNVSKAASKELAAAVKPAIAKELTINALYAPGVGPVKITTASYTGFLTSCGPT